MRLNKDIGVGLRTPHMNHFLETKPELSWLEVHSENYLLPNSIERKQLQLIREAYDISCHGVALSLGSAEGISTEHLKQIKGLFDEVDPYLVSDHLSWSENKGHYFNDLLPLPYTEEALDIFSRNVIVAQEYLKRTILIENPSSYLKFSHSTIPEWEFLSEVQRRTDCHLLLDLNNVYVSSFNHGFNCDEYLKGIDSRVVKEVHLAGFTVKDHPKGEIWIDTHNQPVTPQVWQLYSEWIQVNGSRPTLIEWDLDIPKPEVLMEEARKADRILSGLAIDLKDAS
ncbi:DUF692 domain-containing protein [Vibrio hannami]|uniref:MNIO family bufferin maturase n=1 Tax=Vibrio hannami TaxID=2717094 RepID=UPI00240F9F66|nr:DUF692 domain-containing protein [Vibrio hannami]MDG3086707.1 DUF692 domain-containing protein [Vibrio hannami]